MSELETKMAKLKEHAVNQLTEVGESNIDHSKLDILVGRMKTIVDNKDATLVSGTDESELETVHKNFVFKHLGVEDKDKSMAAIKDVAGKMSGIRMKNRAAFYYLLQKKLG